MIKKFSKEQAAKLASVAKKLYLQSAKRSEESGILPRTANSAETTQNSKNNLAVHPHCSSQAD